MTSPIEQTRERSSDEEAHLRARLKELGRIAAAYSEARADHLPYFDIQIVETVIETLKHAPRDANG